MSLNPHLGHLYHDGNISNIYTSLDVQENLRTREINARETKHLDKYSHVLDRAKSVCRRTNEWEQTCLRKQLKIIESKTPSLTKSLRLESERLRNRQNTPRSRPTLPDIRINIATFNGFTSKESSEMQHPVFVSSWSVYSNGMARNRSAPLTTCSYDDERHRQDQNEMYEVNKSLKISNCIKKAERVTKTLHKLYTRAIERKWKENHVTVLDVLGKESKEELEKALFVLRGSPAGDVIENILKEKEFVSKKRSQKHSISSDKSDFNETLSDVLITQTASDDKKSVSNFEIKNESFRELTENMYVENDEALCCERCESKTHLCIHDATTTHALPGESYRGSLRSIRIPFNSISGGSASSKSSSPRETSSFSKYRTRDRETETTDIGEVFQRDDAWMMSSTLANASDIDTAPVTARWTDLFKTPELWKRSKTGNKNVKTEKKLSLVTLTGKRRQTMLKR